MLKKFWQNVGKKVWVSEYTDSMVPRTTFRSPAPVSQPEYKKPLTAASDLSNNPYYKRDVRRNYPRTAVYTQPDVGRLLLGANTPCGLPSEEGKDSELKAEATAAGVPSIEVKDIAEALEKLHQPVYSNSNMPPAPGKPYIYRVSPEQQVEGSGEYYPSYRVF